MSTTRTPTGGDVMEGRRTIMASGANMRHVRHAEILARWPILPEGWAKAIEDTRLSSVDRTPGTASFGR
ncbi:hypothetical protein [Miltoncostaea marina]|uniref:hypothetical protein n=1 Tax=Miltoncostaea marina TaxID=2843215 RepID=UPI001C3CE717|nr:hypothetical protein [Miltoncostaea marina]